MTPTQLIEQELLQQALKYSPEHDDQHTECELLAAAANYMFYGATADVPGLDGIPWPFEEDMIIMPSQIDNLVRAGALIAAEIARLQRMQRTDKCRGSHSNDLDVANALRDLGEIHPDKK